MRNLVLLFVAVTTLVGCGKIDETKPEFTINQKEVKLKSDGSFDFKIENTSNVSWTSSDGFVGSIAADGKFLARHIGETTITGKFGNSAITARVIVEPKVTGITEPFIKFRAAKSEIKSFEKRRLESESTTELFYTETSNYIRGVNYAFENNIFAGATLLWNNLKIEDATKFYRERYEDLPVLWVGEPEKDYYIFIDRSRNTSIVISHDESLGYTAVYKKLL